MWGEIVATMKKLLATAIILLQLSSLVFAAIPAATLADELSPCGSISVYNLSKLFSVVVDNTMLSLKEIAALAGLIGDKTPQPVDDHGTPADKTNNNPASLAQAVNVSPDYKGASKVFYGRSSLVALGARSAADPPPGSLEWLLFGFMLILSYRLKLFYNSARSAIDFYNAIIMPWQILEPRFMLKMNRGSRKK
jgi:hypothetical protein